MKTPSSLTGNTFCAMAWSWAATHYQLQLFIVWLVSLQTPVAHEVDRYSSFGKMYVSGISAIFCNKTVCQK